MCIIAVLGQPASGSIPKAPIDGIPAPTKSPITRNRNAPIDATPAPTPTSFYAPRNSSGKKLLTKNSIRFVLSSGKYSGGEGLDKKYFGQQSTWEEIFRRRI